MRAGHRALWRRLHLWMALAFGVPIAVIAATGLPITYWYEADALFAPAYYAGSPGRPRASLDALAAAARRALPAGRLTSLTLLPASGTAQAAYDLPGGGTREAALDLANGRLLGTRTLDDALIAWLYSIHSRLTLDRAGADGFGRTLVVLASIACLALLATGLVLWWPRRWRWGLVAPMFRRRRRLLDLHNKPALYLLAPLALAGGTALLLQLPPTRGLGGHPAVLPPSPPVMSRGHAGRSLEALATAAGARVPGATLTGVYHLADRDRVVMRLTADGGYAYVVAYRHDGTVSRAMSAWPGPPGRPDPSLLIAFHQGHYFGPVGQALFAIASLVPPVLAISGLALWLARTRNGEARSA